MSSQLYLNELTILMASVKLNHQPYKQHQYTTVILRVSEWMKTIQVASVNIIVILCVISKCSDFYCNPLSCTCEQRMKFLQCGARSGLPQLCTLIYPV